MPYLFNVALHLGKSPQAVTLCGEMLRIKHVTKEEESQTDKGQ